MELENVIQKYRLDELLLNIGARIRQQFDNQNPIDRAMLDLRQGSAELRGPVTIAAWHLSDLAYLSILHSHDFADRTPNQKTIVELINIFHERDGRISSEYFDNLSDEDQILGFAIGFSQKQFWYQELHRIRAEFNRQVEILEILPRHSSYNLKLDSICSDATGFDLRTFRKLAFALYAVGARNTDMTNFRFIMEKGKLDDCITTKNVQRLMDFYTADYSQIRENALSENAFFAYPIIRTTTNKRIAVNEYFLARKIADGPYWVLRNHFMSLQSRADQEAFVRYFGELFDLYFEKLLSFYFPPGTFNRVNEIPGNRNADWILKFSDWTIIIELKSAFLPLNARKNYPDPEVIKRYLPKLSNGVKQLDATATAIGDNNNTIKILVHYEPFFISDGILRPLAVKECEKELSSKERIFFSDLEDIEYLFQVMCDLPDVADTILLEKLHLETKIDGAARGREFNDIIQRHVKLEANRFVINHIDHYSDYIFPDG